MSWLKLDDCFFRHPKVIAAGRDARDLYLAGLCYCGAGLTDGVIPAGALRILGADVDIDDPKAAVTTLVRVGLWEMIESGEYRVHDYLEYNPSAEKVKAERKVAQERMRPNRSGGVRANNGRSSEDVREPRPVPSYSRTR
jgi:hypothetical protein